MAKIKVLWYKLILRIFIFNKTRRKVLTRILPIIGLKKYFTLKKLPKQEALNPPSFKYEFSIVCIAKNEGDYFKEWVDYHLLIGFDHFYVYNNETEDNTKEILQPYIDKGIVTWIDYPGKRKRLQDDAYDDAVYRFKNETRWMCMIDLDEFVVLHHKKNIKDFMADYKGVAQVSLYWMLYGSSGHEKKPKGLVLENFTAHAPKVMSTPKSIFNPRVTIDCGAHWMYVCGEWVNENHEICWKVKDPTGEKAQINHYAIKSKEEFYERKVKTGHPDQKPFENGDLLKYWQKYDQNQVRDELMKPYVEKLKKMM